MGAPVTAPVPAERFAGRMGSRATFARVELKQHRGREAYHACPPACDPQGPMYPGNISGAHA